MRTIIFLVLLAIQGFSFDIDNGISTLFATRVDEPAVTLMDAEGNVWVGTGNAIGIYELKSTTNGVDNEVGEIITRNSISGCVVEGDYAYVSGRNGFVKYNIKTESMEEITLLPSTNTFSVAVSSGEVYVGTYKGLAKTSGEVFFENKGITNVVSGKSGEIWCLGAQFLATVKKGKMTVYDSDSKIGSPTGLAIDKKTGIVWSFTESGLWSFDGGEWTKKMEYDGNYWFTRKMIVDGYGVIWALARNKANACFLARYDISTDEVEYYNVPSWIRLREEADGAASGMAFGLDNKDRLLIAGESKVAYVTDNKSPVSYVPPHLAGKHGEISFNSRGFIVNYSATFSFEVFTASGRLIQKSAGYFKAGNHSFSSLLNQVSGPVFIRTNIDGRVNSCKVTILH